MNTDWRFFLPCVSVVPNALFRGSKNLCHLWIKTPTKIRLSDFHKIFRTIVIKSAQHTARRDNLPTPKTLLKTIFIFSCFAVFYEKYPFHFLCKSISLFILNNKVFARFFAQQLVLVYIGYYLAVTAQRGIQ